MLRYLLIPVVFLVFFLSCEKENTIEDVISKTWDCEWKQCGAFFNSVDVKIKFDYTDSTSNGWVAVNEIDTCFFDFTIVDQETINLFNSTCTEWSGNLEVTDFNRTRLEIKRSLQDCDNELFRFK